MKNSITFFKNFFFATGVIWFLSALSILILKLNFQPKEIAMTLILPLAWALVRLFEKAKPSDV